MIKAVFYKTDKVYTGFSLAGHAMFELDGPDVLCAAVSGMTNLVINTITEVFKVDFAVVIDGDSATIDANVEKISMSAEFAVSGVIEGFMLQLSDLEEQYPDNLEVVVQQKNITKGN
ncbi:MAG: ribosomal-processing cysteine protease Prp [Ruminococcaceae bacterium]|nr:ribosomal-processing cysteine protease Prp [Oscillospiraceae bacterium]